MYFLVVLFTIETWSFICLGMGYLTNLSFKMITAVIATQTYLFVFSKATVMHFLKVTLSLLFTRSVKRCYSRFERKWGTLPRFS